MTVKTIGNWINGRMEMTETEFFKKHNPHTGRLEAHVVSSDAASAQKVISAASDAFTDWANRPPIDRGHYLDSWARQMSEHSEELSTVVARETGKSIKDALGEVNGAIMQALYFSSEGMRLHGRSLTSSVKGKYSHTVRVPMGVAGLIVPANTPIANIAWKVFPSLICGNTVVLKASEDAPDTAMVMADLSKKAGIPKGVFNVLQGIGSVAGSALVKDPRVNVISFTGSTIVGKLIAEQAGKRLARISLELGGKNPFIVCDDANLEEAVKWCSLSAFSNAGQRCASASRILVFDAIYDRFVKKLVEKTKSLVLGVTNDCDLGPVMNATQHSNILRSIERAINDGGTLLCGGKKPDKKSLRNGYYIEPALIEGVNDQADICQSEIFGPVATIHRVTDMHHAIAVANDNRYGLTAAIHTKDVDRAMWFAQKMRSGVVNVNLGTFGSEPHMPFGGFGESGNGTREPGLEAIDVYSELKNISFFTRDNLI
jgi:alpha-ketoglutaric semialdehyde dehydrogenase